MHTDYLIVNKENKVNIELNVLKDYIFEHKDKLNDFDIWILNGLDDLITNTEKSFENYNFTSQVDDIVKFTWNNFCDWYIEIGKLQKLSDFDLSNEAVKNKMKERYGNKIPLDEIVISPAAIFDSELLVMVKSN